jgi:ABC-2 type transport system ATP-binding protein
MLVVDGICHYKREEIVFDRLSLTLDPGEKAVLIGPHGSGKSLLLQLFSGYILPTRGTIRIHGHDVQFESQKARSQLGYVPSHSTLDPTWTVRGALDLFAGMRSLPFAKNHSERIARKWQLEDVLSERVGDLPHGFHMRILMAAATVHDPDLLLLDDPLLSLDPWETRLLLQTLEQNWNACTILLATNRVESLPAWFSRALLLNEGRIIHDAPFQGQKSIQEFMDISTKEQAYEDDKDTFPS